MICYHRTTSPQNILDNGFEDRNGRYLTFEKHSGVWLSDCPLDVNEGAKGFTVFQIEIPDEILSPFEWCEEGKPYREFLVPAEVVNKYGPPTIHDDDFEGCSREAIENQIVRYRGIGRLELAQRIQDHLTFLERHNLLAK